MDADINHLLDEAADYHFPRNPEEVIDWLTTTKSGHTALIEAMYSVVGQRIVAQQVAREDSIHVLVKVHGDGWVEVMCEDRRVRAEILELPPSLPHEGLVNELADLLVRPAYRKANYWPTNLRASRKVLMRSVGQWAEAENWKRIDEEILEGLDKLEGS